MSVMRCKRTFSARVDGRRRLVHAGDLVAATDAVVSGRERFFELVEEYVANKTAKSEPVVERATAEPGEKRTVGRPRPAPATAPKAERAPGPRRS